MIRILLQGANHSLKLFSSNLLHWNIQGFSINLLINPKSVPQQQQQKQSYMEINKDISQDLQQCSKLFNLIEQNPSEETKKLVSQMFNSLLHESFTISNQLKVLSLAEGLAQKNIQIDPRLLFRKNQEDSLMQMQRVMKIHISEEIKSHKSLQMITAKRIVQLLKKQEVILTIDQINSLLQNLCSQNILSHHQRQLRCLLIKQISKKNPKQNFLSAAYINNMRHYNFSDEQFRDTTIIFQGVISEEKNCPLNILTQILLISQQKTNKIRLDKLFLNKFVNQFPNFQNIDFRTLLTNQIFSTIIFLSDRIEDLGIFEQFFISYIRSKGNQKKYHQSIDQGLVKMSKKSNTNKHFWSNVKLTLQQIKFVCSPSLIYEMVKRELFVTLRNDYFQKTATSNLDSFLFLIAINKYPDFGVIRQKIERTKQKIRLRLSSSMCSIDSFIQLIRQIDRYQSIELYQLLYQNFNEQIDKLENQYLVQMHSEKVKHLQYLSKIFYFHNYETGTIKSMKTQNMKQIIQNSSALIQNLLDEALQKRNHNKIQYYLPIISYSNAKDNSNKKIMEKKCILLSIVYANIKQYKFNNQFLLFFKINLEKFIQQNIQQGIKSQYFLTLIQQILQLQKIKRDNYSISSCFYSIVKQLYYNLRKFQQNSTIFSLILLHSQNLAILNKSLYLKLDKIDYSYFTERQKTKIEAYIKKTSTLPTQVTRQNFFQILYYQNKDQLTSQIYNKMLKIMKTFSLLQLQQSINDMRTLFTLKSQYKILFLLMEELNDRNFTDQLNIGLIISKIRYMRLWRSKPAIHFTMKACEYLRKSKNGFMSSYFQTYKRLLISLSAMKYEEETKNFIKFILSNYHNLPKQLQRALYYIIVRMPHDFSKEELDRISSNNSLVKINSIYFSLQNKLNANQKEKIFNLILKNLSVKDKEQKIPFFYYYQYLYFKKVYPKETENINLLQSNFDDYNKSILGQSIFKIVESLQKYLGEQFAVLTQFQPNYVYKYKNKFAILFQLVVQTEFSIVERQSLQRIIKTIIDPNIEVCIFIVDTSRHIERPVKFHKLLTQSQQKQFYEKFFKRFEPQSIDRTLRNTKSPAYFVQQRRGQLSEKDGKKQHVNSNESLGSMINKNRVRNIGLFSKK